MMNTVLMGITVYISLSRPVGIWSFANSIVQLIKLKETETWKLIFNLKSFFITESDLDLKLGQPATTSFTENLVEDIFSDVVVKLQYVSIPCVKHPGCKKFLRNKFHVVCM